MALGEFVSSNVVHPAAMKNIKQILVSICASEKVYYVLQQLPCTVFIVLTSLLQDWWQAATLLLVTQGFEY